MKALVLSLLGLGSTILTAQAQWTNQPIGFASQASVAIYLDVVDANNVWSASDAALIYTAPQLARTTNGGQSWTVSSLPLRTAFRETVTGLSAVDANSAWLTTVVPDSTGSRILRTTNGGQSWTVQGRNTAFANAASYSSFVHFYSNTEGLVAGNKTPATTGFELYRTTDGGATWTAVPTPATLVDEYITFGKPAVSGNSIWFTTGSGRVFRSTDRGLTWAVSQLPNAPEPTTLAFRDAQNGLVGVLDENGTSHTLYRTTDGGVTWATVTYSGPLHGFGLSAVPGTNQFVSTGFNFGNGDQGSSYTRDNGQTWVALESTVNHYTTEFISPTAGWSTGIQLSAVYGLAGNGVNKFTATTLGTRSVDATLQASLQAVPNPADNGQTTLRVARAFSAPAQVRVLDVTGRLIAQHTWSGAAPLPLNLSAQGAGLYLVEVESATGTAHQKVQVR